MARLNRSPYQRQYTHEGGVAYSHLKPEQELTRTVLACLLWEDTFYESGQSVADRIEQVAKTCQPDVVRNMAIDARTKYKLRHVPLLLTSILADISKGTSLTRELVPEVVQRVDEIGELLAIHAKRHNKGVGAIKKVMPHNLRRGLAEAFRNFDSYQYKKWAKRSDGVRIRDAMFLTHPSARFAPRKWSNKDNKWITYMEPDRQQLYKDIAADTLGTADTWEANLSKVGQDKELSQPEAKKAVWTRMLTEGKMGYMALLRNLRNMNEAGVDHGLIEQAILARKGARSVLPFRFITAVNHAPMFASALDKSMQVAVAQFAKFQGQIVVLVDVSASMTWKSVSQKSELTRADAAAALASMISGEKVRLVTFASFPKELPHFTGLAGVQTIKSAPNYNGGTRLGEALQAVNTIGGDRLIVISDEQSADDIGPRSNFTNRYMINVGTYKNGVGYGNGWAANITGWSEHVLRYIAELEGTLDVASWT